MVIYDDNTLKEVRKVDIKRVLSIKNPKQQQHIKCPFHNDSTPSLVLYPNGGYHCFGCNVHGKNAVDFLLDYGFTFKEAVEELKKFI